MKIDDDVYGIENVSEPVLLDLLRSTSMIRLQGVLQHGITALIGITSPVTRFEHSVGAMILVRRLGGSTREQIAALLHDVSHTAFSHVIDYVFDGHDSQSFHDEHKEEFVSQTDLPGILGGHGYHWQHFLQEEDFPLLEQPSPRLCADRLDYFLRDALGLELANLAEVRHAIDHLVVLDNRIATDDIEVARWLGYTFIMADDKSWANFREVGLYELTARSIRRALTVGAITMADIWGTDLPAWHKMQGHDDERLQVLLGQIDPKTEFAWDAVNPTFRVSTKLRAIDPDVVTGDQLRPLSSLDPAFARHRADYLRRKQGKWPMRVIPPNVVGGN